MDALETVFGLAEEAIGDILDAIGFAGDVICDIIPIMPWCWF